MNIIEREQLHVLRMYQLYYSCDMFVLYLYHAFIAVVSYTISIREYGVNLSPGNHALFRPKDCQKEKKSTYQTELFLLDLQYDHEGKPWLARFSKILE